MQRKRLPSALSAFVIMLSAISSVWGTTPAAQTPKATVSATRQSLQIVYVVVPNGEPTATPTATPTPKVIPCENWSVACSPTTSPGKIELELTTYNSPMTGLGQKIYDLGVSYGVDPNFFMAIAYSESIYGTVPSIALSNHNPGSLRNKRGGASKTANGFAYFDTWEAGVRAFYTHIANFYVQERQLTTVDEILPVYAPPVENNTPKYIADTKARMNLLRVSGQ